MHDIQWSDEFQVGVELIDKHNKHLVELMKQAQDVLLENPHHVAGRNLIDELIQYLFYHFATEEIWMRRFRYEQLAHHIQDHSRCTSLLVDRNRKCHAGTISCLEMLGEMFNMLIPHILCFDADYIHAEG